MTTSLDFTSMAEANQIRGAIEASKVVLSALMPQCDGSHCGTQ